MLENKANRKVKSNLKRFIRYDQDMHCKGNKSKVTVGLKNVGTSLPYTMP